MTKFDSPPDDPGPTPTINYNRRSSQLAIFASFAVLITSALWIIFGFSGSINVVPRTPIVPRAPYIPAPSPQQAVLGGISPTLGDTSSRLHAQVSIRAIRVSPGSISLLAGGLSVRTIRLGPNVVSLSPQQLVNLIHDSSWIRATSPGVFAIDAALIFQGSIGLNAQSPATERLNLRDRPGVFVAIDGPSTSTLAGITVSSVDQPSRWLGPRTFRPFLEFDQGAIVHLSHDVIRDLGWDWNRSYGISWLNGASGSLSTSTISGNFIGIYTQEVPSLTISDDTVNHNHLYGIDPHTSSTHITVSHSTADHNAAHGIIAAEGVSASSFIDNTSDNNGESGIVLYQGSSGNVIRGNTVEGNRGDGIELLNGSLRNSITSNTIIHNRVGIFASNSPTQRAITGNVIHHNLVAAQGIDVNSSHNSIASNSSGNVAVPTPSWSWIITRILWPLNAVFILVIIGIRRRELNAGWRSLRKYHGLPVRRIPAAWRHVLEGYRAALEVSVAATDACQPIHVVTSLPFAGPPPVSVVAATTQPVGGEASGEGAGADAEGSEVLSSDDDSGTPPGDRRFRPDIQ